ncbi:MAG: helical backbone metal receptor [Bacteroidota bacterium]
MRELATYYPIWVSDIGNLVQALDMIDLAGTLTRRAAQAQTQVEEIKTGFKQLPVRQNILRTAYLVWQKPYITVGSDTFIHDMLDGAGFNNIFKDRQRYPIVIPEEIGEHNCRLLLLSSEPFPFKQTHVKEWQARLPSTNILLADGEMFSWYGSGYYRPRPILSH